MSRLHDVVVVGAGPGGSAAAHYLAARGLDVLLLDKDEFPRDKTCGDGLTPRALHVLADMGILEEVSRAGFRINGLQLHARSGSVFEAPIPEHPDYPNHLLIVPRLKLDDIIRRRAVTSGAEFEAPVRVRALKNTENHIVIHADQQGESRTYKARVAILAIGANMRLLQDLGLLKSAPRMILAARAYYQGVSALNNHVQAHFSHVPLPGYGWVFPLSETSANVGVGFWPARFSLRKVPSSTRSAMEQFLKNPKLEKMLKNAKRIGKLKSYPLRIDFTGAPTFGERILLVGETAGLVSPLTGEGIDFALESGQLAAEFLPNAFAQGDFSRPALAAYDRLLRRHFQSIFRFLNYARRLYVNPLLMSRMIAVSERRPELKRVLVNVLMSQQHPSDLITPSVLKNVLLGI